MMSRARIMQKMGGRWWIGALAVLVTAGTQAAPLLEHDAQVDVNRQWADYLGDQVPVSLYTEALLLSATRDDFYQGIVIAENELNQMRAGFNIGGLDVDFGARLQTKIDNSIELVSLVNFTKAGVHLVSQTLRDPSLSANQVGSGTGLSITDVTPSSIDLSGLANFSGVTLSDPKGFTAALHNITRNAIISGVVSNASGRDIQQQINIDVRLNNIGALRAAKQRASIVDSLSGILR
ncbi:hypothetical protein [Vreelandella arcis]|uniref:Uncharacterized protein n=1 Tax=Vreelandella arcis TaxID=416873 RepID=A0A1H0J5L4_9GAMM|nr:hypothetical protein [Halomonas arcis]SDO38882.1 hypothetical protein SAMN04487951_1247 [Halomonas arcis]